MEINSVLTAVLIAVFIVVGVALVFLLLEVIKLLKSARSMINDLDPTLKNVETITTDIQPTITRIPPLMDRLQLTVDAVNLEMIRIDEILEDVSEITDSAAGATAAVENVTSAPLKAVSNVATRLKQKLSNTTASEESAQLAEQRVAVAQALKDYEAAEEKAAAEAASAEAVEAMAPEAPAAPEAPEAPVEAAPAVAAAAVAAAAPVEPATPAVPVVPEAPAPAPAPSNEIPNSYVKIEEGVEPVIDPKVIAESPFFDNADAE